MSGNALPFVGNFYVYLIVFANTFQIQIKYAPFCDFKYKYTKFLVYKYVFEPNPECTYDIRYWKLVNIYFLGFAFLGYCHYALEFD